MSFYLDASVIVPTLTVQRMSDAAHAFMLEAEPPFLISDLAEGEVASAASRLVRTRVLTPQAGRAMLTQFDAWLLAEATPVEMESTDGRAAIALLRRFELMLRTPDALHVVISQRLSAELVTFDDRLLLAATALGLPAHKP